MAEPKLMLDRSRAFASVHGEGVFHAFEQDGLPFDNQGELIKRLVTEPDKKAVVEKKLKRLAKLAAGAPVEEPKEPKDEAEEDDVVDLGKDINFEAWLKDEVKYEQHLLFKEAKRRFSKVFSNYAQLAEFLVYEENVVGPSEVPTKLPKKQD